MIARERIGWLGSGSPQAPTRQATTQGGAVQKLDGKRALVTGGASGIGYAVARLFLENGARTVISDIDGDKLASAERELAAYGTVRAVAGDVRSMATGSCLVLDGGFTAK
jgi:FlaA1/EpsC-like NDP-sugar epimerase